ncbi:reverse transcriptase domain-containing protein [Tanacetum coccineum]
MHGHGHPELAKKLNDKIPKTFDEMWKRVRAFIGGETATNTTKAIRSPQWEKSAGKASWSENQNGSRNRSHRRGEEETWGLVLLMLEEKISSSSERHQARRPEGQGISQRKRECYQHVPRYQLMDCPVVVDALIEGFRVRRIHVDGGSSSEVIYEHCFRNLSYRTRSRLKESRVSLVGFSGEVSYPLGVIDLEVTIGECEKTQTIIMKFAVVKSSSPYNALLGRKGMRSLGAVASTIHSMIKFPTSNGIATIATTRETLRKCRQIKEAQALSRHARVTDPTPMQTSSKVTNPRVALALVETRPRRPGKEPMQWDDMEERRQLDKGKKPPKSGVKEKIVVNDNYPEQLVTIGGGMSAEYRHALIHTLQNNVDIFAWTPADITGIPRAITEHSLDTYPHIEPKAQKKRRLAPDR